MNNLNLKLTLLGLLGVMLCPFAIRAQYGNTVREDLIWDYQRVTWQYTGTIREMKTGYHFDGSRTLNDHTYAIFKDGEDNEVALLRQEDSKIYLYLGDYETPDQMYFGETLSCLDAETEQWIRGEVLIYDFSIGTGDKITCATFDTLGSMTAWYMECIVEKTFTQESMGHTYNCQEIWMVVDNVWIDGIGCRTGLLPFPQAGESTTGAYNVYDLHTVRNTSGEIIYQSERAGVKGINAEYPINKDVSPHIYDLLGRRVEAPAPGNLYIINGKKVVWK